MVLFKLRISKLCRSKHQNTSQEVFFAKIFASFCLFSQICEAFRRNKFYNMRFINLMIRVRSFFSAKFWLNTWSLNRAC